MKKFLALSLILGSAVMFVPPAEAKTADLNNSTMTIAAESSPQRYTQRRNRRARVRPNRRARVRVVTRARIVRIGYRRYREVVQYRYLPNGRVTVRVLSRTRIR